MRRGSPLPNLPAVQRRRLTAVGVVSVLAFVSGAATATATTMGAPAVSAVPTRSAAAPATAALPDIAAATPMRATPGAGARRYLGTSRSRLHWHSGAWVGGWMNAKRATSWGPWRGTPSDVTMTFPDDATWTTLANSTWHIDTFEGFRGRLVYGLPLLPDNVTAAQLRDVAAGKRDATFRKIARDLRTRGRGNAVVKLGWEANGTWMSFSATTATAPTYRAAWRRVAQVMAEESPNLVFSFEVNCGTAMKGQRNRLDSLTRLYPGNDVVDLVGCSSYDWWNTGATTEAKWRSAVRPAKGPGIADVAAFARARGKGLSMSEWGLAAKSKSGNGDNAFYIRKMKQYFDANADILVLEQYFNEPAANMGNSMWPEAPQNPRAGAVYRRLW